MFRNGLLDRGFVMSKVDPCLFMSKTFICVVHVNDFLFWSRSQSDIDDVMKYFKDPPPWIAKKHLLVQSRVKCTAFSDQNQTFKMIYHLNFFHMNEIYVLIYPMLHKLSYLNL